MVTHPETGTQYRLGVHYLRTEDSGPLFECMKAKLAGIASHSGMTGVFRLRGSDVYRVETVEEVPGTRSMLPASVPVGLEDVRAAMARLSGAADLAALLDGLLDEMISRFGISHATSEFGYGRAMREDAARHGVKAGLDAEIPFPGLPESQSQIAVPILAGERLLGVLFAESPQTARFGYDEEDAFATLASHVGAVAALLGDEEEASDGTTRTTHAAMTPTGAPLSIRHYAENDSVFVGEYYLIKGVAGAILWRLLRRHADEGRCEHTNRELRLDPAIRLPDLSENLEARLILLARRLEERCPSLRIEKTGRGRFRFRVLRPVSLQEIPR